jgi:hypothetical protein
LQEHVDYPWDINNGADGESFLSSRPSAARKRGEARGRTG